MVLRRSWLLNILVESLYIKSEKSITGSVDIPIPKRTLFHSSVRIDERAVFEARALPQTLDIRAWLSLVGSPLNAARVAQRITVIYLRPLQLHLLLQGRLGSGIPSRPGTTSLHSLKPPSSQPESIPAHWFFLSLCLPLLCSHHCQRDPRRQPFLLSPMCPFILLHPRLSSNHVSSHCSASV